MPLLEEEEEDENHEKEPKISLGRSFNPFKRSASKSSSISKILIA